MTFTWNTTGFSRGKYFISICALPVEGELRVQDNFWREFQITLVRLVGDVTGDRKVDLKDVYLVAKAYGSYPSHPKWNPNCDINDDGKIDLKDYYFVTKNFGAIDP